MRLESSIVQTVLARFESRLAGALARKAACVDEAPGGVGAGAGEPLRRASESLVRSAGRRAQRANADVLAEAGRRLDVEA